MANVIKHKRGSGSDPSASDLVVGELAIRTDTGKLFTKMDSGALAEIAGGGSDIAINTLSSSSGTGGGSSTFNGSAYRFTLSSPPAVSAQQLLVSINGVIQKPVAGTGQPSEGFSVDGNDIILGDAPATGSDFFILTFRSLGVSVPADNSVTSAKIATNAISGTKIADGGVGFQQLGDDAVTTAKLADGAVNNARIADDTITNAKINSSAAIAGTKISPDFGSQNIITTGEIKITNAQPGMVFEDTGANPDFIIQNRDGSFAIRDTTNAANRFLVNMANGAITGTGDMTIDTNTLHVDSSNNRVGIGTTSPDSEFHVLGGGTVATFEGTGGGGSIAIKDSDDGTVAFAVVDAGKFKIQTSGSSYSDKFVIDTSGNCGIGTTSPDRTIHCHNSSNTTNVRAKFSNGTTGEGASDGFEIGINASDPAEAVLVNNENSPMVFFTNASERMRIDSSGKVGINSDASGPDKLLHVSDTNNTGDVKIFRLTNTGGSAGTSVTMEFECGLDEIATISADHASGDIGNLMFATARSQGAYPTEAMRIDQIGNLLVGTQTVIQTGTERPLQIQNTGGPKIALGRNDTSISAGNTMGGIEFYGNDSDGTFKNCASIIVNADDAHSTNSKATRMQFFTTENNSATPAERLRIKHNGQIQAGTNTYSFTANASGDDFVVGGANSGINRGITIYTHQNQSSRLCFAEPNDTTAGMIKYEHGSDVMQIFVESSEVVRIDDNAINIYGSDNGSGRVLPATDNGGFVGESTHRWTRIYAVDGDINTSDRNEKNTIVDSDLGLSFVNKLKPVSYKWNSKHLGNKTHYGLIAQDIEEVIISEGKTLEDFAAINKEDNAPMGLAYSELIAPLIKAIQELTAKVEALEAK